MDKVIEQAVGRAIEAMREGLGEELTVDDMARAAMFSKFHFSRIFQRATGLSPGRFLSAMRLQRAKQLLVSTSLNVTDISHEVGYNSVGTFSTRFTSAVGISPTTYRRLGGYAPEISVDSASDAAEASARVRGAIRATGEEPLGFTFIGLFPQRIPQGHPVSCTVLERPGPFTLEKVPPGSWYLLAHAVPVGHQDDAHPPVADDQPVFVLQHGPIQIRPDHVIKLSDLHLHPIRMLDPPVLLALLDVRTMAMATVSAAAETAAAGDPTPAPECPAAGGSQRDDADLDLVSCAPGAVVNPVPWRQQPLTRDDAVHRNAPPIGRWRL